MLQIKSGWRRCCRICSDVFEIKFADKQKCSIFAVQSNRVPWMSGLVSGLQNRVRRFESARNLKKSFQISGRIFCFVVFHFFIPYSLYPRRWARAPLLQATPGHIGCAIGKKYLPMAQLMWATDMCSVDGCAHRLGEEIGRRLARPSSWRGAIEAVNAQYIVNISLM